MSERPIYVTQPAPPPLEEFAPYMETIWANRFLTNGGSLHQRFEQALATALQALRIAGEVITTPYSFVATAHSLLWNGVKPVFVDIDPDTLNIDPTRIEAAITPQTTAILPVHCYGNPCHVDAIQEIADNYNLKVIYDAAHAFGVQCHCGSALKHGDLSVLSIHATNVFDTFEGGAIVCPDARTKQHIDGLKNFGFVVEATVVASGINGKMLEFSAPLRLLLHLEHVHAALSRRQKIDAAYREQLRDIPGITCPPRAGQQVDNYTYFPILVRPEYPLDCDALYAKLQEYGIHGRCYLYPLISQFPMYRGLLSAREENLPIANEVGEQVICLPIFPDLSEGDVARIVDPIRAAWPLASSMWREMEVGGTGRPAVSERRLNKTPTEAFAHLSTDLNPL